MQHISYAFSCTVAVAAIAVTAEVQLNLNAASFSQQVSQVVANILNPLQEYIQIDVLTKHHI